MSYPTLQVLHPGTEVLAGQHSGPAILARGQEGGARAQEFGGQVRDGGAGGRVGAAEEEGEDGQEGEEGQAAQCHEPVFH